MTIISKILDWFIPARVCRRTGEHLDDELCALIMKPCYTGRNVAEVVRVYNYKCTRCGRQTGEFHREELVDAFQSVCLPSEQMQLMNKRGWIHWE